MTVAHPKPYEVDGRPASLVPWRVPPVQPAPWRRRAKVPAGTPMANRRRATLYARQDGYTAGAATIGIVAEGLLAVHDDLPPHLRGKLTARQRRRLVHKHRKAVRRGPR